MYLGCIFGIVIREWFHRISQTEIMNPQKDDSQSRNLSTPKGPFFWTTIQYGAHTMGPTIFAAKYFTTTLIFNIFICTKSSAFDREESDITRLYQRHG